MTTLRSDQFTATDFAIDGVGYMLEPDSEALFGVPAWSTDGPDIGVERQSLSDELSDNKLDALAWASNRSWHEGAGQKRHDQPEFSSPNRYLDSEGVDITEKGQLTLLPACSLALALTNTDPTAPQKLTATDSYVFVATAQPNLRRFSALDASDVATISTGTESGISTYDLASDGSLVYVALAGDGTHRYGAATTTQREAFDATTGFTLSGGAATHTADTATYKEGTASLSITATAASSTTVDTKSLAGGPLNFSAVDQFKIWVRYDGANVLALKYRLLTSAGNYFERTFSFAGLGLFQGGDFVEDVASRTTDFTSTGSPNWASIASIAIVITYGSGTSHTIAVDDFRTVTTAAGAHYCDWDARVLGWAKDRLYAAGVSSGTTWRFYEVVSGTPTSSIYTFPDGWEVTDIQELQGFVYIAAKRGRRGVVYAYDGTNAPFAAVPMPPGEQVLSLFPFLGAGLLIGGRRLTSVSSGGIGVVYRAFPTASGALNMERVLTIGSDDGKDYGVRTCTAYGDWAYFGYSYADSGAAGLGLYIPETGGWSRGLEGTVSKIVVDSVVFKGRRIFTLDGSGVWVEGSAVVASGYVVSSLIDLNVSADKVWLQQESTFASLVSGQTVTHEYSTDGGTTWSGSTTDSTAGDKRLRTYRGFKSQSVHLRTTLGTNGASPTLYSTGIGGWAATKPFTIHRLVVRAYPDETQRTGVSLDGRDRGWGVYNALEALRVASLPVQFQAPDWPASATTLNVRVTGVKRVGDWGYLGREGQGGCVLLELKEVGS